MEDIKKKEENRQAQVDEEYFMQVLFDTYRHQYGDCVITEVTEEKPA